jgi:adenylate cyclase
MRLNVSKLPVSRRDLRLISGVVMLLYLASHLANHALGLVSLDTAEVVLATVVGFWRNPIVTAVLYGAAGVHVALAIVSAYERRTFRLPAAELLRIALGFWLPVMLIGHAITTRLEYGLVGAPSTYARVVSELWARDGEWQHMGLLAPGWLHGCLGLNFAFARRPSWRRYRFILFAVALLLPVLSALGFVEMGRELARQRHLNGEDAAVTAPAVSDGTSVSRAAGAAIAPWRTGLVWGYLGVIGLAFTARGARNLLERRQGKIVTITYPDRIVWVPRGWSVLEASRAFQIAHVSSCGGRARCSTCRVRVVAGVDACPPPGADEQATLERIRADPDLRLACQLRPRDDISIIPLTRPDEPVNRQKIAPLEADRDVVILLCQFSNRSVLERDHLAHDVLFVFTRYAERACSAVNDAGGTVSYVGHDNICAVFGLHDTTARASRQALTAAREIGQALDNLNGGLDLKWGCKAKIVISIHAGFAALSYIGQGVETVIAAGPAMEIAEELGSQALHADKAFAISNAVFEAANVKFPDKNALAFSFSKDAVMIGGYALDAIPDGVAGGRRRYPRWRKTLVDASSLVKTIVKS